MLRQVILLRNISMGFVCLTPVGVGTTLTYLYRAAVLEQNGLLFIGAIISVILDEIHYNLMFTVDNGLISDLNIGLISDISDID